ncbi:MAG: NAD(P)-dependent oxidoreductase [Gemmatimonadota bacterium]
MTPAPDLRGYAGVRAVVLGASGFIGRWAGHALTGAGAELHAVVRDVAEARRVFANYGVTAQVHEADLTDFEQTRRLLLRLAPAIVFNLSGYGVDPGERTEGSDRLAGVLNADLPGMLAKSLAAIPAPGWAGRRIVHVGSILEYGQIGGHLEESSAAAPFNLYGRSKLAGTLRLTEACESAALPGLTARLCQVYGPGEHPGRLLPMLIEARGHTQPLSLSIGTQSKDFTYVGDVAEGLLRLGLTAGGPGEVVNLASGRLDTVREFTLTAAHLLRLEPGRLKFEKPLPDNELQHLEVATDRLRTLTDWVPATTLADGIRRTLDFLDRRSDG